MAGQTRTFVCSECGQAHPLQNLAKVCLDEAGTRSTVQAVVVLDPDDLLCQVCADAMYDDDLVGYDDDDDSDEVAVGLGRLYYQGSPVDPAILQTYRLNY